MDHAAIKLFCLHQLTVQKIPKQLKNDEASILKKVK